MFRILRKEVLAPNIYLMDVEAPRVAKNALPGQFLIVRVDEAGERIPLKDGITFTIEDEKITIRKN